MACFHEKGEEIKKKVKGIKFRMLVLTFLSVHGGRECVDCGSGESDLTRCHLSQHQQMRAIYWAPSTVSIIAPRGNKGHFHGAPLDFLNGYIAQYIATTANAKESLWTDLFPAWDEKYPTLKSTERKELEEEDVNYQAEIDRVKQANTEELAKRGHRKAAVQPHPSEQLNKLRAHAADRGVG
jgi:hypothetical protein